MIVPVILAGGSGTRLWPLSRNSLPKQFLSLVSSRTLLQETLLRLKAIPNMLAPIVICNQAHRFLVAEQLKQIDINDAVIILEPVGRNTAPAAAIAALHVKNTYQTDPVLFVLPADHLIRNESHLKQAVAIGEANALKGKLVTFGVQPTHPATGYGYIKIANAVNADQAHEVLQFIEKPTLEKAQSYIDSGDYSWNSGMFMFQSSRFLAEMAEFAPDILSVCQRSVEKIKQDFDFSRIDQAEFESCPSNSIDYAVMEKTKQAVLVPLNTEWSDVGSWASLCDIKQGDNEHNVIQGDVHTLQVNNSYIHADSRLVVAIGIKDQIIVETSDVVLIADKAHSQLLKEMVDSLKKQYRSEIDVHPRVYRPWGHYETIDSGDGYLVKRIVVKPGARLSLQSHQYRSEHWVVVRGTAEVTCAEETFNLKQNQSTYIAKGLKHRLSNPGEENLEIIEVQSGAYLGEDDIVRYDDVYGRLTILE